MRKSLLLPLYLLLSCACFAQKKNVQSNRAAATAIKSLAGNSGHQDALSCNNWLDINNNGSGVAIGDLDVTGQLLTVEATFNRTQPYTGGSLYSGDLVSKHYDPNTINYLLRPNGAEITTTNGYAATPAVCEADLNKTYHVAMTYDGTTLKFYRNGFLMSQKAWSGNLYQNNYPTTIGANAFNPFVTPDESMRGYVNEVRIWNVVRSQSQIQQYMNSSLPNPQTQAGLLAYYTFDNLTNKQGNPAWNGSLLNNAQINQFNPTCASYTADSCDACHNWLATPSNPSYVDIGNLNITGDQLTIEAEINRTTPYAQGTGDGSDGDIVSKHYSPDNTNYLLRPNHAYITTTNGFVGTEDACEIELNKTYHVAMVYDGKSLKFYRNGFLLSQVPATGNLVQNGLNTLIGNYQGTIQENFIGYINEVRIWNVARSQSQIRQYMNSSLPNPQTQAGLLAYYTFDNLTNKQGNTAWNGSPFGNAQVNQLNPTCSSYVADSCDACGNWYFNENETGGFRSGDLDVNGHTITVEADINRTQPYVRQGPDATVDGDIVSKHRDRNTTNYLLRPNRTEITTTNGYFRTPDVCEIELNKTYHVAMSYDGATLKFYRDGYLMSSVPATGELVTNDYPLTIGNLAYSPGFDNTTFKGYINNVRIWNVVKTQSQLKAYMDTALPNPTTQPGLLADFTFNNLLNKQGNSLLDGSLINGASIRQKNPTCASFTADSCTVCGNWLATPSDPSYVDIGNLSITGDQLTIEAEINRTTPYSPGTGDNSDGDIVSKHTDTSNTNYLLRPNHAYITTSNGFFATPDACAIELNKTYHVAMVYDGKSLKFYRNGFLLSQVAASGNLTQNTVNTWIGNYQGVTQENFIGYINEVRIWNVARQQSQIQQYVDKPLPNPTTQPGLLAYYTFESLQNKQGNDQWGGTLVGAAFINQKNPTCGSFVIDSCGTIPAPVIVTAGFTAPDTVCVNASITLKNTSSNATSNYWSFCSTDLNTTSPDAANIGNPGNLLSTPVFMDIVQDGNSYYGFVVNHHPGSLTRLDFGSSLLNTPTTVNLGNFGGILPADYGAEGIQVVKNNGTWYAIIVGGSVQNNEIPRIIQINFGSNIQNASPVATNWGNIGNLSQPIDLYVFYESGSWYGFTTNAENNTITRFSFGKSFDNSPTGTNLGSFGGTLNYPTGIYALNDEGNWHLYVTNYNSNSLTRLDFGNSLLNTATAVNLGTIGGTLKYPRDITILKSCNSLVGYVVNGDQNSTVQELVKLDFQNSATTVPKGTSLGNNGSYSFPHSISKLFRVGNDLYSFIPNANSNTLSRLKFAGCTNANIPNYSGTNPPQISYNSPGRYNVVLSVDEGLPTQTTFCKQITVLDNTAQLPTKDTVQCDSAQQVRLSLSIPYVTYSWNNGSKDSAITVTKPGKYWVQLNKGFNCTVTDTFNVRLSNVTVNLGKDTGLCAGQTLLLNAGNNGSAYLWQDGSTKQTYTATKGGSYYVRVTNTDKCAKTDTVQIVNYPSPLLSNLQDKKICNGNTAQLSVTANGTGNIYSWSPASTLNNATIANPVAKPTDTTNYTVTVTNSTGCVSKDTATVFVLVKPVAVSITDTALCFGDSVILQSSVSNANSFGWSPSAGLSNAQAISPKAKPAVTTPYILTATNDGCSVSDTVRITINALPVISLTNDTLVCNTASIQLSASGGIKYQWSPAAGLSNPNIANPVATVTQPVTYLVIVTNNNGCVNTDSVHISKGTLKPFTASTSTPEVCAGDSIKLSASGGDTYAWQPAQSVANSSDSSTYAIATTSGTYSVKISNRQCQVSETKDVIVAVNPKPQVRITKSNDIDCHKQDATLTASGATSYRWSPVIEGSDSTASIKVKPDETAVYKVTSTSDKGCVSTDTISVKVNKDLEKQYPMPNAFSPNGDGINECFGIKSWNVLKVDFKVFDQWGWQVFHSTDPANVCWDGRYNGKNQLDGTYVYKIYAVTACGIINKWGTFVLIRAAR